MAADQDLYARLNSDDREVALTALRSVLAGELVAANGATLSMRASAAKELRAIIAELEALAKVKPQGGALDELKARSETRRSGTADPPSTTRRGQPRRSNGSHRAS